MKAEREASSRLTHTPAVLHTVSLLLFSLAGGVEGVNITSQLPVVRGVLGGSALLSVSYTSSSSDRPVIKWQLKRDKPITVVQSIGTDVIGSLRAEYRDRIQVFENGSLQVHNLQQSDEGAYEVEISITDDTFTGEKHINLTVDVPVSRPYVHMVASSVLELSELFTLNCSHQTGTKASYSWTKGGKSLANDTRLLLSHDQRLLTIMRVLMSDDDVYSCNVENPISTMRSAPVKLTVYRRSSLYIILSTGGIFLLITLVTVCACWKPSKKKKKQRRLRQAAEERISNHEVDVVPRRSERRKPMALYVLNESEYAEDELDTSCGVHPCDPSSLPGYHGTLSSASQVPDSLPQSTRKYPRTPVPSPSPPPHSNPPSAPGSPPQLRGTGHKLRSPVVTPPPPNTEEPPLTTQDTTTHNHL
ncbi:hypothetical protein AALO_G00212010 [Alosa alosa]|uniref:Ig-like domain-containing protein n=1 Tax=Alosa alosa TaxID=278164 RepID=A0AAV6G4H6_9TELE|nr:hepatic and glial cell adhesion molecule a [Alosa alosa]KAG5268385.1 hypothetical protein AALO_G00212010 [Alosa alosa]